MHYVIRQPVPASHDQPKVREILPEATSEVSMAEHLLGGRKDMDSLLSGLQEIESAAEDSFSDLPDGLSEMYEWGRFLGEGTYAKVYEATTKEALRDEGFPKTVAIKCFDRFSMPADDLDILKSEIAIISQIDHPACLKLYEAFDTIQHNFLVMELLSGGDLFKRILDQGSFSETQAAAVVCQVASGLEYMHKKGIVHRDLKPENLMYKNQTQHAEVKIMNFRLAEKIQSKGFDELAGTPGYIAPEVVAGELYGELVDIWSLGCILYILLSGVPAFLQEDVDEGIMETSYSMTSDAWHSVSAEAKTVVRMMLSYDPSKRVTATELLANPWVEASRETAHWHQLSNRHTPQKQKKFTRTVSFDSGSKAGSNIEPLRSSSKF